MWRSRGPIAALEAGAVMVMTIIASAPTVKAQTATLTVEGQCPGQLTARVTGGTPEEGFPLLGGLITGEFRVPNNQFCAGTLLGIRHRVRLITTISTDENGNGEYTATAGPHACGHYLQALDLRTCEPTNVVQIP